MKPIFDEFVVSCSSQFNFTVYQNYDNITSSTIKLCGKKILVKKFLLQFLNKERHWIWTG